MSLNELSILSFLLLHGTHTQKEIAVRFRISKQYTAILFNRLITKKLIKKGKGTIYKPDSFSPIVKLLNEFLLIGANNKNLVDQLNDMTAMNVLSAVAPNAIVKVKDIHENTGISRPTILAKLNKLIGSELLEKRSSKPIKVVLNKKTTANTLLQRVAAYYFETETPEISVNDLLDNLKGESNILILVLYGSYAKKVETGESDIDIFAVVNYETDKPELKEKYIYPRLDFTVVSKKGFLKMIKSQPHFINQIKTGKIIKGEHLFNELIK